MKFFSLLATTLLLGGAFASPLFQSKDSNKAVTRSNDLEFTVTPRTDSTQKFEDENKVLRRGPQATPLPPPLPPLPPVIIPNIPDIKDQLTVPDSSCLFYSGPGGYAAKAVQWRNQAAYRSYRVLSMMWKDQDWRDPYVTTTADAKEFNGRASQAMAELCSGTVYVLLPSDTTGTNWQSGTVWDQFEWPNLGPAVTKVIRVNPDNAQEEVIRG